MRYSQTDRFLLDPLAPYIAKSKPAHPKGKPVAGSSNFFKHSGGEARWFDYSLIQFLGDTKTKADWLDAMTAIIEEYPKYGSRGGKSARVSATRIWYALVREDLLKPI